MLARGCIEHALIRDRLYFLNLHLDLMETIRSLGDGPLLVARDDWQRDLPIGGRGTSREIEVAVVISRG